MFGERIIVQKGQWTRRQWRVWQVAWPRMDREFNIYNKRHFGGRLRPPTCDLDDGPARFLTFTAHGSLFVPLKTAMEQPWRMVQETVLQQMVHQMLYQEQKLQDGPEHTRAFNRFCEQPRVRLDLSMTYGLPGFAAEGQTDDEQRLYQRIRRLLALGESPNQHEAEAAVREAQRLMLKHNIDMSLCADRTAQSYGVRHLFRPMKVLTEAQKVMSAILREFFFVKGVWVPTFDPDVNRDGTVLEICGTTANLEMACHVVEFLTAAAQRLWKAHQAGREDTSLRGRSDYIAGVHVGFRTKLFLQQRMNQIEGLIWLGDQGLDDFYKAMHPKTVPLKVKPAKKMTESMQAGMKDGKTLDLHRPVTDGNRGPRHTRPARPDRIQAKNRVKSALDRILGLSSDEEGWRE